jgi:hypothetical protein
MFGKPSFDVTAFAAELQKLPRPAAAPLRRAPVSTDIATTIMPDEMKMARTRQKPVEGPVSRRPNTRQDRW